MNVVVAPETRAYLEAELGAPVVSELGFVVAGILDDIFGLDNLRRFADLRTADWKHVSMIQVAFRAELSTFDGDHLTRLVVRCHDDCVRLGIAPLNPRQLRLIFSRRDRVGHKHERHPTLEEAITRARTTTYYGPGPASLEVQG